MSMSTYVVGVRDLDIEFEKMLKVKLACEEAGIGYPDAVRHYFNGDVSLSAEELRMRMSEIDLGRLVRKFNTDGSNHYEVRLADLPKDVVAIRFTNSW